MIESSSLTTRLSFGDSGIRVGLARAFVQRIAASLLLGRLSEVFLRLGTAAPVALEAEAALSLTRRLASGHSVVHVAHDDGVVDCTDLGPPLGSPQLVVMARRVLQGGWLESG